MGVLIATPKAADATSFLSVATAGQIFRRRLYTELWDAASSTPDAEDFQTSSAFTTGSTTIGVDTGTGTFTAGTLVKFAGHATEYTVSTALTGAGNLSISPGIITSVADDEAVERLSASTREKSLMWSTQLLSEMMIWYGYKTTDTQALPWPRIGVIDPSTGLTYDKDTIPAILEVATCEMALVLLSSNVFVQPSLLGKGFSAAKIGPMSITVDNKQQTEVVPQNVLSLLSPLGYLESEAKFGSKVIPLGRA